MDDKVISVPYIVFEGERARHERDKVRWFIICLVLILLLFGSNAGWLVYESQYANEVKETYTSEALDGGLAIVNRDGAVNYGESNVHPDSTPCP